MSSPAAELKFLLEIGSEEIPDWMIPSALENLRLLFEKLDIPHESVTMDATPRRLVLRADGLAAKQPDSEEKVMGPAKSAPAQAVAGFTRKLGVKPEDLSTESTPKGEYYYFIKKVEGRATKEILAEALPGLIQQRLEIIVRAAHHDRVAEVGALRRKPCHHGTIVEASELLRQE